MPFGQFLSLDHKKWDFLNFSLVEKFWKTVIHIQCGLETEGERGGDVPLCAQNLTNSFKMAPFFTKNQAKQAHHHPPGEKPSYAPDSVFLMLRLNWLGTHPRVGWGSLGSWQAIEK